MREYKEISPKAQKLLDNEENFDVDFKRNGKVDPEDLVAFANSKNGGTILLGVDEFTDSNGRQKGKPVGCPVGQESKDNILTKAQHCIPPVNIEIIIENLDDKPFYRIEIPSGKLKPYCTQKGIYKIRDDGNNKLLTPYDLLTIFMETESEKFLTRFKKAYEELESNLNDASRDIWDALSHLEDITSKLDSLEEYSYMSDEILGKVNEMERTIENIDATIYDNEKRIIALLDHFDIEDPHVTHLRELVQGRIKDYFEMGITSKEDHIKRLKVYNIKEDILELWYEEAINELNK